MLHTLSRPVLVQNASPARHEGDDDQRQYVLSRFNRDRLAPGLGSEPDAATVAAHQRALEMEKQFVLEARAAIAPLLADVPTEANAFVTWFERLKDNGPGQNDPLFPWLAEDATLEQMRWFLTQEVAGEAGFDDLVAMTQVKMPPRAKLEMARNYWDEMGRGNAKGMHGPMLDALVQALKVTPHIETTLAPSLALGNTMVGLATNRLIRISYGPFQLGEMAPGEVHEIRGRVLRDQLGAKLASAAGADFTAPIRQPAPPEKPAAHPPRRGKPVRSRGGEHARADRRR